MRIKELLKTIKWELFYLLSKLNQKKMFTRVKDRFHLTDIEPVYGKKFYLLAVQLVDVDGGEFPFTEWITAERFSLNKYRGKIAVGKDYNEWTRIRKNISEDYTTILNQIRCERIPFKEVVALKIRYVGEKNTSHVFHYTPRRP